jgi:hypothetical protein
VSFYDPAKNKNHPKLLGFLQKSKVIATNSQVANLSSLNLFNSFLARASSCQRFKSRRSLKDIHSVLFSFGYWAGSDKPKVALLGFPSPVLFVGEGIGRQEELSCPTLPPNDESARWALWKYIARKQRGSEAG